MLGDIDVERSADEEGCRQGGDKLKKLKHRCIHAVRTVLSLSATILMLSQFCPAS